MEDTRDADSRYRCSVCDGPIFRSGRSWVHWVVPTSRDHHRARPKVSYGS